jgi:hypothetical protein
MSGSIVFFANSTFPKKENPSDTPTWNFGPKNSLAATVDLPNSSSSTGFAPNPSFPLL